jgi:isoquinoline 1-oxidoreductase alpha subunit
MAAVSLLSEISTPSDEDINNALRGHICRCGTYERARAAIHDAAKSLSD